MDFDIILFVLKHAYNSKVYNPPQIEVAYTNKTQFTLCGLIFLRNLFLTFDTGTVPRSFHNSQEALCTFKNVHVY